MASTFGYTFDNLSRIGNDSCAIGVRDIQNQNTGNYLTKNYFESMCGMKKPIAFATNQPNVFYNAAPHSSVGAGGCNVESDSNLKIGQIQTHPKCKINLHTRPFLTVPFLGRGPPRPVIESRIQQGSSMNEVKSCKTITEQSFQDHIEVPLVPTLAATIQNPVNLVEGVAAEGWIRGGLPSRELSRDRDYLQRHK